MRAIFLCLHSGVLLLLIQQAQLLSFRTMGFGGFSFSTDLPAMISWPPFSRKTFPVRKTNRRLDVVGSLQLRLAVHFRREVLERLVEFALLCIKFAEVAGGFGAG
jgi:hypothetical protein